jgi:GWxTD domain-containing protein
VHKRLVVALAAAVVAVTVSAQGPQPMPDKEWKHWLDQVRPLIQPTDAAEIKVTAPSQRAAFRESFWRVRNPDPSSADNPVRLEYEQRARQAESRFRHNGKGAWNDCGRTWMVLGKPDVVRFDQSGFESRNLPVPSTVPVPVELWTYRRHPRLPTSLDEITFRFDFDCEVVENLAADRLLRSVAATYVIGRK